MIPTSEYMFCTAEERKGGRGRAARTQARGKWRTAGITGKGGRWTGERTWSCGK